VTGFTAGSASPLNTLVASGNGGGEGQGLLLLMILLAFAVIVVVLSIVNRVRQPYVVVVQNPFKLLMKTVLLGVTTAVVAVAIVSILIATAGSPS
jgi:hypothetical protein